MGIAEIRKRNGEVITLNTAEPFCALKEATLTSSLMGDDYITLKIVSSQWLSFAKGDKITYEGKEYTVRTTPTREVVADGYYNYEVVFYGVMYDLMKTLYRNCDDEGKSDRSTFDLTYTIKEFVQVVINNLNRDYPGIWAFDELNCPQTEAKTLQFAGVNCLQALQTLCTKDNFNLEFQITQDNGVRTIHIGKFGKVVTPPHGAAYFEWGKGNGLFNLKEQKVDDKAVITRLWVEGGTKNIRTDYRNYSERLQLPYPKRNNAYEHTLEDGRVVLPNTEAIGIDDDTKRYLEDAALRDQIGSEEDVKLYKDIYPTRTGTVTALVDDDLCAFIDDTMDFDLNAKADDGKSDAYLVNGTSAKVTFTSGRLAGQEFELEAKGGYNHALKKFRIIAFTDNRGLTIPSAETHDAYYFEVGDTYKITDIYLPESYEKRAEENLWYAGMDDFNQAKQVKAQYSLTFDRLYFVEAMPQDADTSVFEVGDFVPIKDTRFGIEKSIRIQKIQRNLLVAHDYQLTLADSVAISIQSQTVLDVIDHEQIIENNRLRDLNKTRRGWRTTEELRTMVYDPDGYFDPENIRPNSIDTNMLTVGSKSQQFVLTGVVLQANGGGNPQVFVSKAGVLSHLTIDPTGIRQWHMKGARFTFNNANAYYLFARCPKVGGNGTWFPSQTPMKCEPTSDPNAYYFQVGVIGSLQAGDTFRDFVTTYGFTRINGNTITTGRIVTSDGECYLDLDGNKFRIGDSASSVDWNVTRRNGITLKNVSVASGSGDVSPLGVYRGVWNAAYTYFQNDEVSYTANGATATYRYVNPQPTAGNLPTDSVFWAIVAKGADGVNGDWATTVFKQSDTKPDAPIGTAPIPNGWADAPSGDGKWWMSKGIVNGVSGEVASWSDPVQVTAEDGNDGAYTDFKYAKNNSDVAAPSIVKTDRDPAGWSDEPPALSQDEYLWMSQAEINANGTLNGQWSDPVRISGEKGADGADGQDGQDGVNGDFTEYRYAVNGSKSSSPTLASSNRDPGPAVWNTAMPTNIAPLRYVWMTQAKINGTTNALIGEWSTPIRVTPYDGKDGSPGRNGATGPVLVFRGNYDSVATYYGTAKRIDAVKYNGHFYIRTIGPDTCTNQVPTQTTNGLTAINGTYWNDFGAEFETIATNLLLAEGANIGDWFIQSGQIVSTLDDTKKNRIMLQVGQYYGSNLMYAPKIILESENAGGDYSNYERTLGSRITLDATQGIVRTEATGSTSAVSYLSPTGIFANRAATEALPASSGCTYRSAIVGLGFANVNKQQWQSNINQTMIAGVFGRANNTGTAPAYGGFFQMLYAGGIVLGRKAITANASNITYLNEGDTMVVGYTSNTHTVYLPSNPYEGQVIFVKQWWIGKMTFKPRTGHSIYDDSTENATYDFSEGQGGMFVFSIGYIGTGSSSVKKEAWIVSRWKF